MNDILADQYAKMVKLRSLNEDLNTEMEWPVKLPNGFEYFTFDEITLENGDNIPLEVMYEAHYAPAEYEYFNDKRIKMSDAGYEIRIKRARIPTNIFDEELNQENTPGKYHSGQDIPLNLVPEKQLDFMYSHLEQYHNR